MPINPSAMRFIGALLVLQLVENVTSDFGPYASARPSKERTLPRVALEATMTDESGAEPAHEPHNDRGEERRHEPGRVKTRKYSGHDPHHGGVQHQKKESEGQNGDGQRENEGDRTN